MDKEHTALHDLLIESCRHAPDANQIEAFAQKIDDWKGFLDSAYAHGVFPLVHKSLKLITAVPDRIKHQLKSTNLEIARRNMTMTAELLKIMKLLEENGIPALAIKGPVLSQMIHGDVTQRQYADIDILLERSDMYRAVKILTDVEYTTEHPIEFLNNEALLNVAKDYSVFSPTNNIHIEFHWQLFLKRQVRKSKIELFSDFNPVCMISQQSIKTLENDENIIYLLLHGSKHMWERLEWIVDIDRLIRLRGNEIDWDRLCQLAREMEIEVMLYLGLAIVYDLFQTPLKDEIIEKIASMVKVTQAKEFIVKRILENTIHEQATKSVPFVNLFKMRLNKDSRSGVIRHYFVTLFSLKDFDVYMVNLPNHLSFLYHFIRLYRMFRFYVLQMPHR